MSVLEMVFVTIIDADIRTLKSLHSILENVFQIETIVWC